MIMLAPSEIHGAQDTVCSEEFERLPLKHRLKLLLARNRLPVDSDVKSDEIRDYSSERIGSSLRKSLAVENSVEVKIGWGENNAESRLGKCMNIACPGIPVNSEAKLSLEVLDKLDHVPLKERLKMLLASEYLELSSPVLEASHSLSGNNTIEQTPKIPNFADVKVEPLNHDEFQSSNVTSGGQISSRSYFLVQTKVQTADDADEDNLDQMMLGERLNMLSSRGDTTLETCQSSKFMSKMGHYASSCSSVQLEPVPSKKINHPRKILQSGDSRTEQTLDIPSCANVKVESPNLDKFICSNATYVSQISMRNFVQVKTEVQTDSDAHEDDLDHLLLSERMKLLSSRGDPSLNTDQRSAFMSKMGHSAESCGLFGSKSTPSLKINRSRKRRKTATGSIEIAMEEDAPGLLQVLIEKGVSVNEMKLYGEPESNDALDDSPTIESFEELEEVMTKLFSHRESLLKCAPVRCSKGEKASYCLECLFSLVEQARYLQFRHWPVEWGWCRDLQSFIFVFERHNRIVLERPEYGYATYFFELTDSLPIKWQVKRLVTAMKLSSCSRVTLIENKALMVGDDLSEGEARVLMEYGWIPNTGLGTMLNYYDRVVHDRRNEKDGSEWRTKIGKLLTDGYNGGTIIPTAIPSKFMERDAASDVQIKVEFS